VITLQELCHYGSTGFQRGMAPAIASIWCVPGHFGINFGALLRPIPADKQRPVYVRSL